MSHRKPIENILLFLALLAAGCSSTTQGEKMVQSYSKTMETVATTERLVDQTLITLQGLRTPNGLNIKDAFRQYKDAVAALEKQNSSIQWRSTSAKEEQEAHIQEWQREMSSIKDAQIKSTLESRKQAVRTNFALVQMYADDARKAYDQYVKGSKDLVQALSIDLSPAAITSLSPSMDRVMTDGGQLKQRITALHRALDNIANGVSPIAT